MQIPQNHLIDAAIGNCSVPTAEGTLCTPEAVFTRVHTAKLQYRFHEHEVREPGTSAHPESHLVDLGRSIYTFNAEAENQTCSDRRSRGTHDVSYGGTCDLTC